MRRTTRVLVADMAAPQRDDVAHILKGAGHEVLVAGSGRQTLELVAAESPDAVVLETHLGDMSGIEVCRRIKKEARLADGFLPVLFLSDNSDVAARVEGLRAGADDFLGKPAHPDELVARIEVLLRTRRVVMEALRSRADLEDAALHDPLTGLYNQRYLVQRLEEEFRRAERFNEPLALMAVDLDQFEEINGRFGRGVGDRLLHECARVLLEGCRKIDIVTRAGGDEFVVVLPNTHFAGALHAAQRAWTGVRAARVDGGVAHAAVEASVGVSCYPSREVESARDLLRFAHAALARAKAEGRGKICLYQHQGYLFQPQ